MSFPIIDISQIDEPQSQQKIAQEITKACREWGFLLVKGHGIPSSHIDEMFQLSSDFFHLPEQQKEPWPLNKKSVGYIGALKDRAKDDKMSMWLTGVPGALASDLSSLPSYWHQHTEKVERFKHQCHGIVVKMLICFALAMGLPDKNYFADAHKEDAGNGNGFRLIMYPARDSEPDGTRMSPHTDSGSVTLLFQDAAGLEVESPTGDWVKAPCLKDHILINLGDALCFWSGGQLKATMHRVTKEGVPYNRERQTMAYFGSASPDTVLEPIDKEGIKMGAYNMNGITIYPGITVGEYGRLIMEKIYGSAADQKAESAAMPKTIATAS